MQIVYNMAKSEFNALAGQSGGMGCGAARNKGTMKRLLHLLLCACDAPRCGTFTRNSR